MQEDLGLNAERVDLAGTVRWCLPRPDVPILRRVGLMIAIFGLGSGAFVLFWLISAVGIGGSEPKSFRWIFAIFGLPFLIGTGVPIVIGWFLCRGRIEIDVTDEKLITRWCVGPLVWGVSRRLRSVTGLKIAGSVRGK